MQSDDFMKKMLIVIAVLLVCMVLMVGDIYFTVKSGRIWEGMPQPPPAMSYPGPGMMEPGSMPGMAPGMPGPAGMSGPMPGGMGPGAAVGPPRPGMPVPMGGPPGPPQPAKQGTQKPKTK